MGHVLNYTLGDVVSHVRRRNGWSVLRPMGYDAFGLPAENAAIREGGHPREVTERNIAAIRGQIRRMGWSIDWTREVSTHEPEYYRWTQWLFLKLYEAGLAYRKAAPVKWCPNDQTVLANEQVIDGRCERCGAEVESRNLEQWMFKITDFADRLLDDMAAARLARARADDAAQLDRPLGGRRGDLPGRGARRGRPRLHDPAGHALRGDLLRARARAPARRAVRRALGRRATSCAPTSATPRRRRARSAPPADEKTGVFTGFYAVNPVNDAPHPDLGRRLRPDGLRHRRDHGRARRTTSATSSSRRSSGCRSCRSSRPPAARSSDGAAYVAHSDDEVLVNSGQFTGLSSPEAKKAIVAALEERGLGHAAVNYRLRDWLLSRQRYWGCPIPVIHCERLRDRAGARSRPARRPARGRRLPAEGPLAARGRRGLGQRRRARRAAAPAKRETDTMDTFVDSSWYFLRYTDPHNDEAPFDRGARRLLAAGQPVHRRDRARDPAPDVRALLREGARTISACSASTSRSRGSSTRG